MQPTARYPSPAVSFGPHYPVIQPAIPPASYTRQDGPTRPSAIQQPVVVRGPGSGYVQTDFRDVAAPPRAAVVDPAPAVRPAALASPARGSASEVMAPQLPLSSPPTQVPVRFTGFYRPPAASPPNRMVYSAPMRVSDRLAYTPPAQTSLRRPGSAPMQVRGLRSPADAPATIHKIHNPADLWYRRTQVVNLLADPLDLPVDSPDLDIGRLRDRLADLLGSTSQPSETMATSAIPSIRFNHTGEYSGFANHSPHRVMYRNKEYPTASHLLEALKFTHQPALQERIHKCKNMDDMYTLSASFQEHVRSDWGEVSLNVMEVVLYLKFKQHPSLRALLLGTGLADIIYSDENTYWGESPLGEGANELGKALIRVRERLQEDSKNRLKTYTQWL